MTGAAPGASAPAPARVRDAVPADDEAIADLLVRAFTDHDARRVPPVSPSAGRLAELRHQPARRRVATVLVAERDGAIVGTVCLFGPGAPGSEAWIKGAVNLRFLATDLPYQGQGVSSALLDSCEARARQSGAIAVCLHVRRATPDIVALYQSRGYERAPEGDLDHLPEVFLEAFVLSLRTTGRGPELDDRSGPG